MRYGRAVPDGWLPVYSVDTEDEARRLLVVACPKVMVEGKLEYVARELVTEQTLPNLYAFADRLRETHERLIARMEQTGETTLKQTKKRRRSRREVIAWLLGTDISSIDEYQPGRNRHVFTAGTDYYYAARTGEHPPKGWEWADISQDWHREATGYSVFRSSVGAE